MTQQLGVDVEHRPSVFAARARRIPDGHLMWGYRVVCACGAQTHPMMVLSWLGAMSQAATHLAVVRQHQRRIEQQVTAFRARLEQ